MKRLLIVTALMAVGAGAALLVFPSLVVKLLLGSPLDSPVAGTLGRVAGAALIALGAACGRASGDTKNRAARGLVCAMTFYNVAAMIILGVAGIRAQTVGAALWPAVALHAAMAVWCVARLVQNRKME